SRSATCLGTTEALRHLRSRRDADALRELGPAELPDDSVEPVVREREADPHDAGPAVLGPQGALRERGAAEDDEVARAGQRPQEREIEEQPHAARLREPRDDG